MANTMKDNYINSLFMIEKINKLFMKDIKREIGVGDNISNTQYMLLYKIGKHTNPVLLKQFKKQSISYCGENLTYNLKAMEQNGYIKMSFERPKSDMRSRVISLSKKGEEVFERINEDFESNLNFLMQEKNWVDTKLENFLDELYDIEEFFLKKDVINTMSRTKNVGEES